jgi:5-formyltetrahydrofolate cyclo-ligase
MLRARGARLCVPAVVDRQTIEFRELVRGAELVRTGFGTSGPGPDAAILDPQLLLMPLSVILTLVMYCSFYPTYTAVFERPEQN